MLSVIMLNVTYKPYMLNVFMLSVVMLIVVVTNKLLIDTVRPDGKLTKSRGAKKVFTSGG